MDIKDLVKEINVISLSDDEFLVIQCPSNTPSNTLEAIRRGFHSFMDGKYKGRIIILTGNIELTKVTKQEE